MQKNLGLPDGPVECSKSMGRSQLSSSLGVGGASDTPPGPLSLSSVGRGVEMKSRGKKLSMAIGLGRARDSDVVTRGRSESVTHPR